MSTLESHLSELVARTVQAAGLGTEWIDVFRPLFHIEHVRDREADWIEIRFDYLGATSRYECQPEEDCVAKVVADAAQSFGHALRWEQETSGALEFPVPLRDLVADGEPSRDASQIVGPCKQVGTTSIPLRPAKTAAGVGMIALGGVIVAVLLLTVFGYLLAEEDEPVHLLVSVLLLGGLAGSLIFFGLRLLSP